MAKGPRSLSTGPARYDVLRSNLTATLPGKSPADRNTSQRYPPTRRIVSHREGGPLADLKSAGRTVVLNGIGPLIHRQTQPAVCVADEVDAGVIMVEAKDDPVPAGADLEALWLEPAQDRDAEAAQVVHAPSPACTQPQGAPSGRWSEPLSVRRAVPCSFSDGQSSSAQVMGQLSLPLARRRMVSGGPENLLDHGTDSGHRINVGVNARAGTCAVPRLRSSRAGPSFSARSSRCAGCPAA